MLFQANAGAPMGRAMGLRMSVANGNESVPNWLEPVNRMAAPAMVIR